MDTNLLPDYEALFGEVDFKKGDAARTVYSPGAYLSDLLQLMDDEFTTTDEFHSRRNDIKKILLDAENTNEIIPYLDIVNEVLESKISPSKDTLEQTVQAGDERIREQYAQFINDEYPLDRVRDLLWQIKGNVRALRSLQEQTSEGLEALFPGFDGRYTRRVINAAVGIAVYAELSKQTSPVQLPFNLHHERLMNHLGHLQLTPHQLRHLFALHEDVYTVARESLKMSIEDWEHISRTNRSPYEIVEYFGFEGTPAEFEVHLSKISTFMEIMNLNSKEMLELVEQHQYVDDQGVEDGQGNFFVNQRVGEPGAYAKFDESERYLRWSGYAEYPGFIWIDASVRFIKLSRISGISMPDLDLILRQCGHRPSGRVYLNIADLLTVSIVKHLKEKFDVDYDQVVALVSELPRQGFGNGDLPQNLFHQVYNNPCVTVDGRYILCDRTDSIPPQFVKEEFRQLHYGDDLFSDENVLFRQRIQFALGYSDEDLRAITNGLEKRQIDEALWMSKHRQCDLLNYLYRIHRVTNWLEISYTDLYLIFDLIQRDPSLKKFDQQNTFVHLHPSHLNSYEILLFGAVNDRLWLIQTLCALTQWMSESGFEAQLLWDIVNAEEEDEEKEAQHKAMKVQMLNGIYQAFKPYELRADSFVNTTFDNRLANIIHSHYLRSCGEGGVHTHDPRLVKYDESMVRQMARRAVGQFDYITAADFEHLQIESKLTDKLFQNMVYRGYINTSGRIMGEGLPSTAEEFYLETDFSQYRAPLFALMHQLYKEQLAQGNEEVELELFISDLEPLNLSRGNVRELYDNLIFNNYIDEEGVVQYVEFFGDEKNIEDFDLNTELGAHSQEVYEQLRLQLQQLEVSTLQFTKGTFSELNLSDDDLEALLENLTFNGYLDEEMVFQSIDAFSKLTAETMDLSIRFYPQRHDVYKAISQAIDQYQAGILTIDRSKLSSIADRIVAQWAYEDLSQDYLDGMHVSEEQVSFFKDASNREKFVLSYYFEGVHGDAVFNRVADIIKTSDHYRFTTTGLEAMGFDLEELDELIDELEAMDVLDSSWKIPAHQVEYFLNPDNALTFNVDAFEDYAKEVFYVLHEAAKAVRAAENQIDETLREAAADQRQFLFNQLQNVFGVDGDSVRAMSRAIFQTSDHHVIAWMQPILEGVNAADELTMLPPDQHFNVAYQRMVQFSRLAKKLALTSREIDIAFHDQDLVMKFPEELKLPDGVDHIDAILEDGALTYLFANGQYYIYYAQNGLMIYSPLHNQFNQEQIDFFKEHVELREQLEENPIKQLMEKEGLDRVDAAFKDREGNRYIVSGTYYYLQLVGAEVWEKRKNAFGQVNNTFNNLHQVDAAYRDKEGRLFLFAGQYYVRYTRSESPYVDQGYPKKTAEYWAKENLDIDFPAGFQFDFDAALEGKDGNSYFFKGDQFFSTENGQVQQTTDKWGHTKYDFSDINAFDAALNMQGEVFLFSGENVIKYRDCIENDGLQMDPDFPAKISDRFSMLPDEFYKGIDAAYVDQNDNKYFFKDDESVMVFPNGGTIVFDNEERWGKVHNPLQWGESPTAAFVGLDGKTYLFADQFFWRYSTEDYTKADDGYPAKISEHWHGVDYVDAAIILDGKTYIFGRNGEGEELYIRFSDNNYEVPDIISDEERKAIVKPNQPDIDDVRMLPGKADDEWWSLPQSLIDDNFSVDSVLHSPDGKTYLFSGNRVVHYEHSSRWWSQPEYLHEKWGEVPYEVGKVEAALGGKDGKIYLFYGDQYLRFSDPEFCKVDEGFPRTTSRYWGKIQNNIERTGVIDAAMILETRGDEINPTTSELDPQKEKHLYLFSGDQYYRYPIDHTNLVDQGYPKKISPNLKEEFRFKNLEVDFADGIDAAFADYRNVYLFKGENCYVTADDDHKIYIEGPGYLYSDISLAVPYDGGVLTLDRGEWTRYASMEDVPVKKWNARPRFLNGAPDEFKHDLNTVLQGTDGNTYLFKHNQYYDHQLKRVFSIEDSWGKVRNNIHLNETIDAAFHGRDGRTYVFSGDQYFTYDGTFEATGTAMEAPEPISSKWGGLKSVALAYVQDGDTYLFEHPDQYGAFRYVRYSDDHYHHPDAGYPQSTDASFWNIPQSHLEAGFTAIDTIFVEGDNLIFISDDQFIRYNTKGSNWSYPTELSLLYDGIPFNKTNFQDIKTGFVDGDGTTYFFNKECFVTHRPAGTPHFSAVQEIRDYWGKVENTMEGKVDAAFIDQAGRTYLFSGQQFVRYSTNDYRFIDLGYPKPIAECLRKEDAFKHLPQEVQNELDQLQSSNSSVMIDGVVENLRNLYLFLPNSMIATSRKKFHQHLIGDLGHVKNNLLETGKVDAAFTSMHNVTFLFSGDQYYRYHGSLYNHVDEGYPKLIAEHFSKEFAYEHWPADFDCDIDAAARIDGDKIIVFKDDEYVVIDQHNGWQHDLEVYKVADAVGKIRNVFESGTYHYEMEWTSTTHRPTSKPTAAQTIDGAYIDDKGHLYVYKHDQYVRYSNPEELFDLCDGCHYEEDRPKFVDMGYPMQIADHCPSPPDWFIYEGGVDAAFRFQGKTYYAKGNQFVGYADGNSSCQHHLEPSIFRDRWGDWSDFLIADICTISRFKALEQASNADDYTLTDFLHRESPDIHEPYMVLAQLFDFDKNEVRWLKRRNAFLAASTNQFEHRFRLEEMLRIHEILSETKRLNVKVEKLYEVWQQLYEHGHLERAANGVLDLLASVDCNGNYQTLFDQIHSELNVLKRDALVPYVVAKDDSIDNARELFKKLLIDIEMESCADTSRVVEAIAAVQLYLHRYFVNLEEVDLKGKNDEEVRAVLKEQWKWMRNYRVWEANRKVFLYPENYIRPELRDTKTPSFEELEEGLLQGEITDDAVLRVYTKYLDQYTEVSALKLAGGYVFDQPGSKGTDKRLVLFGRTKVAPIRYFYRFGTFLNGDSSSAIWEPWLKLNISIESERVYPVYAFNRVFVFWSTVETIIEDPDSSEVTVVESGNTQTASSSANLRYRIKIFYSFYNLNREWVQPQQLKTEFNGTNDLVSARKLTSVRLFVEESSKLGDGLTHDNIVINCQFHEAGVGTKAKGYSLTPELYSQSLGNVPFNGNRGREMFQVLFEEGQIEEENVVQLNSIENSLDGPWFAYDHKGGGFLCKPDVAALSDDAWPQKLSTNPDDLCKHPAGAAFYANDVCYFFNGGGWRPGSTGKETSIQSRWGRFKNNLKDTGIVNAAYRDGNKVILFSGDQYYRYTALASTYATLEFGFPKDLAGNTEGYPWNRVDAAVKLPNGETWLFNNETGQEHLVGGATQAIGTRWGNQQPIGDGRLNTADAGFVWQGNLYIFNEDTLLMYGDESLNQVAGGYPKEGNLARLMDIISPGYDYSEIAYEAFELKALYSDGNRVAMRLLYASGLERNYSFQNGLWSSASDVFIDDSGSAWTAGVSYTRFVYDDAVTAMTIGFYHDGEADTYHARVYEYDFLMTIPNADGEGGSTDPEVNRIIDASFHGIGDDRTLYFVSGGEFIRVDSTLSPAEVIEAIRNWDSPEVLGDQFNWSYYNPIVDHQAVDSAFVKNENLYLTSDGTLMKYTKRDDGTYGEYCDDGYPTVLSNNGEGLPTGHLSAAVVLANGHSYYFRNDSKEFSINNSGTYYSSSQFFGDLLPSSKVNWQNRVDAAFTWNNKVYLIRQNEFIAYTLGSTGVPESMDYGYPKILGQGINHVDAAFELSTPVGNQIYLFSGDHYYIMTGDEPNQLSARKAIKGNWGNIPADLRSGMDAALNVNNKLFFFKGGNYISYITNDSSKPKPFEIDRAPYEVIRLTSSTAEQLNQLLFAGGVDRLLSLPTQQIDEIPSFSTADSTPTNIKVSARIAFPPVNSHIDFNSANGIYYWEVFFHAPFLIANSLNSDQKFEESKQWYEYIYDPTEVADYWKFLPFLAVDPEAMMQNAEANLQAFKSMVQTLGDTDALERLENAQNQFDKLNAKLMPFADVFIGKRSLQSAEQESGRSLQTVKTWNEFLQYEEAIHRLVNPLTDPKEKVAADMIIKELDEVVDIIGKLDYRWDLMNNKDAQIETYLNDPFDPHAIASLRRIAYRKTIVMHYIDNLLDWGDMLFRQYTRESITEARMFYVLAYDLLGERPASLGRRVLPEARSYDELYHYEGTSVENYEFMLDLENTSELGQPEEGLTFAGTLHDSIANPYFYIKENEVFADYWNRVEDRLFKIRNCQNIMGIEVPLALFAPPIDPAALVNAVAGGGGLGAALGSLNKPIPHYRFSYMLGKSRELASKLTQFGNDLLAALEKKDAESLSILQNSQEATILGLTTQLKEKQIEDADFNIEMLEQSKRGAEAQLAHYDRLLKNKLLPEETTQIALMTAAASVYGIVVLSKIVSGLAHIVPQFTAGAFSFGVTQGGRNVGEMLGKFGEGTDSLAEGLSIAGEAVGVYAQYKRSEEDWQLQKAMATSEIAQLEHQIEGARVQKAMAQRELQIHEQEIKHNEAISTFMKEKFTNEQLYSWMSGKLSGLYFQTYKMAHDMAKQAETAFQFETGTPEAEINFINGMYWDSQRKGLLSGESLELDLDRMEKAFIEQDVRGFEITKNISLVEHDPMAFLQLKSKGVCEFRLGEALFDYDFPGHYNRQIKSIAIAFDIGEGQFINATLTQLNHKLVMKPDPKAVKYLLNPNGEMPDSIRVDWKVNQQIALSHVDEFTENSGLFELRFDTEKYLPFEGTGAVSLWRLELGGKKGTFNPNDLLDATIRLRYTSDQGGTTFGNTVRGMLKPYEGTAFFDLAYSFAEEWNAFQLGDEDEMELTFDRSMFPNMSSSKIMAIMVRYDFEEGKSASLVMNDDVQLGNNQYVQVSNVAIGKQGSTFRFSAKGDKTALKNVEMVMIYKAKV